jgi:integrase
MAIDLCDRLFFAPMSRRRPRQITPKELLKIWLAYTEFRKPSIAYSTLHLDYRKIERTITKIPDTLTTSPEIRDWVSATYSPESARRIIQQFNACCSWAFDSDLHPTSPFSGMGRHFRKVSTDDSYRAFTATERDTIITTFKQLHPFYLPWVQFCFWTGCRPEEAAALRWEHIHPNHTLITFKVATPVGTKREQPTKNRKVRDFPTNDRLKFLLKGLQPFPPDITAQVFTGKSGGRFEYHNFQTRYWKPLIEELVGDRLVFTYLSQYHMRHTWISLALEAGVQVPDVAYLSGNTPQIIYKYYASRTQIKSLPDF